MNNQSIQKLIDSHKADRKRLEYEKTMPQIKVSRAVSFFAVLYEKIRNTVEYEEEHLLRKRAIKRIMLRLAALKGGNPDKLAETVVIEIILAQYLTEYPVPGNKISIVAKTIYKYQYLIQTYRNSLGKKISKEFADMIYSFCAFEIERILVPYNAKDNLVNAEYYFINNKGLLSSSDLPKEHEPVQTYISCHRAGTKSDDEIIAFHLFYLKFPFWANPNKEQVKFLAQNLDSTLTEITHHLNFKVSRKRFKEIVRQSIPFKILNTVIQNNLTHIDEVINNKDSLEEKIQLVCNEAYKENKRKLQTTIIRSIIYIFITKLLLAFLIEVPYDLKVTGHLNFITLGINILFPALTMFIVANSFSIPSEQNTLYLQHMINAILNPSDTSIQQSYLQSRRVGSSFRIIFQLIYFLIFIIIFGGIIFILYMLNFNPPGMLIFVIFFSTIFFVAAKLRNTASELRVVNTTPSIFAPIIDMFSTPLLLLGKRLSEGASQFNFLTIILDFFIEAPFKTIIKVFEEWNHYVRETREEIV